MNALSDLPQTVPRGIQQDAVTARLATLVGSLFSLTFDLKSTRRAAAITLVATIFAAFFIVEHSLTASLTSERADDVGFVDEDLDAGTETGSMLRKIGFLSLGAIGLACLSYSGSPLNWRSLVTWLVASFGAWLALSLLWAADFGLCARRVFVVATMAAGVAATLRLFDPQATARLIGGTSLAFVGLGLVCELGLGQFRPWSGDYRLSGTTHPNTLGVLCAFATFFAMAKAAASRKFRTRWIVIAALTLIALYLTKSRTALAATMIALGVLWTLRASWAWRLGLTAMSISLLAATILGSLIFQIDAVSGAIDAALLGRSEEVTTLTGRTPLWAELNRDISERPLAGYGFGSFWTPDVLYRVKQNQGWQIPHAHSGYYETLLNLGSIGLGLVVIATLSAAIRAARRDSSTNIATGMTVCVATFAAIYSITDTAFALPTFASFVLVLMMLQAARLQET